MKRIFTILLIVLVTMSVFTLTAFADEPTEAVTEAVTEEPTEAKTEEPTAKPTDAPTESPKEEQGTPITFEAVFAIGNKVIKLVNKHKTFITSALSSLTSLLLALIVAKFKSKLKKNNEKNEAYLSAIKEENKKADDKLQEKIKKIEGIINDDHETITNMIESYKKERADLHAADAMAEINHQFATMMYHLIMNSNAGMGVKDEVEQLYKDSEKKIKHMIEDAKDERGKEHGTGEEQSTEV